MTQTETQETKKLSPQQRWKCACPSWTTRRECIQSRYPVDPDLPPEECECACHEEDDDDAR